MIVQWRSVVQHFTFTKVTDHVQISILGKCQLETLWTNQRNPNLAPNAGGVYQSHSGGRIEEMPVPTPSTYGRVVVLKRTGQDSASFDLTDSSYLFGRYWIVTEGREYNFFRGAHCDIRIQLATISEEHCRLYRDEAGHVHGIAIMRIYNEC